MNKLILLEQLHVGGLHFFMFKGTLILNKDGKTLIT